MTTPTSSAGTEQWTHQCRCCGKIVTTNSQKHPDPAGECEYRDGSRHASSSMGQRHVFFDEVMSNKSKSNTGEQTAKTVKMSGQERYTYGMELRWVVGSDANGPAAIYDRNGERVYNGTYAGAEKWVQNRGLTVI